MQLSLPNLAQLIGGGRMPIPTIGVVGQGNLTNARHETKTHTSAKCEGCSTCRYGFRGAGILLVDEKNGDILLCRHAGTKRYSDQGGLIDQKERCSDAASRETLEETRGTVSVSPSTLLKCRYVDVGGVHKYRCYVYYTSGSVSCSAYYRVDSSKLSPCYRETDAMTRFSINGIKAELQKNPHATKWTGIRNNTPTKLEVDGRVIKIVRQAIKFGLI